MKKIFTSLALAAITATTLSAQVSSKAAPSLSLNPAACQVAKAGNTKALRPDGMAKGPARVAESQRSHKELSYFATGKEWESDWQVAKLEMSYDELLADYTGYGFAQLFNKDLLTRYVDNTISQINFYCWGGTYTNGRAFIIDMGTNEMVWSGTIDEIKPTLTSKNWQRNSVPCAYTVTGEEEGLLIGWVADAENNEADSFGEGQVCIPMFNDPTGAGAGCYIVACDRENGYLNIISKDAEYYDWQGKLSKMCTYMTVDTEGDNSIADNDVQVSDASAVRGVAGSGQAAYTTVTLENFGLDPVTSIDYTFTLNGKSESGTCTLTEPITYYTTGKVQVPALLSTDEGKATGTFTVDKVNGKADPYTYDNDNTTTYAATTMLSGYKRIPVIEEFTSTTNGDCPNGFLALRKASEATGGEAIPISIHVNYNSSIGADPFYSDSFYQLVMVYATKFPSALVNRETVEGYDYSVVPDMAATIASGVTEAEVQLNAGTPDQTAGTVKLGASVTFKFDTEADKYGVAYVFTEDGIEGIDQLSNLQREYESVKEQYPEASEATILKYLGYEEEELKQAATTCQEDADGYYWYQPTFNHVALSISQSVGYDCKVPAAKAGVPVNLSYTATLPTRTAPAINFDNVKVTALLIDLTSGAIVNARQVKFGENSDPSAIENASATTGKVDIQIANGAFNVKAQSARAEVFTTDGKLVSSCTVNGEASLPTFGHGTYIIRVEADGHTTSQKAAF